MDMVLSATSGFLQVLDAKRLKKKLIDQEQSGLALDIDETISYTLKYWGEYLIAKFGNPEELTIDEIFAKYGYFQNYWSNPAALAWMDQAIRDDLLHEQFEAIPGATDIVSKIHKVVPIVVYITNRPVLVQSGTIKWLKKNNFPPAPILFKPKRIKDGSLWKGRVLVNLFPQVVGIIDDHLGLIEKMPSNYNGRIYFFAHDTAPRKDINVIPCKTWDRVLQAVQKDF